MSNPWTPGPWTLDESSRIVGADGETLVGETRRFTIEEAARVSADRRLQAAAPEMAEALEMLVDFAKNSPTQDYNEDRVLSWLGVVTSRVDALLARIRGDAP